MLAVSLITDTAETVTGDDTLETFTFRSTNDIDKFAFLEDADGKHLTIFLFMTLFKARKLCKILLRSSVGFCKVTFHGLVGAAFFLFAKSELDGLIAIFLNCSYLCDDTRTSFNHCARNLFSVGIKKTGHTDFLSN